LLDAAAALLIGYCVCPDVSCNVALSGVVQLSLATLLPMCPTHTQRVVSKIEGIHGIVCYGSFFPMTKRKMVKHEGGACCCDFATAGKVDGAVIESHEGA
jgi:uncharacterized membrane protein YuzA (DUF378 family)